MPSFGAASAQAKAKPKYRLHVSVSGVPSKVVLNQQYTYVITVVNTGRLKLNKVVVPFRDGTFVVPPYPSGCKHFPGASPHDESTVSCTLMNVRAGATSRITFPVVYNNPSLATDGNSSRAYVVVYGYVNGKKKPVAEAAVQKLAWY